MIGHCRCTNMKVEWQFDRASEVHPVICDCEYCTAHNAQYVFQAGTAVEIHIRDFSFYGQVQQGTKTAVFHECRKCGMLVCVTVESGGKVYGAISRDCFPDELAFATPLRINHDGAPVKNRIKKWEKNWCSSVTINSG